MSSLDKFVDSTSQKLCISQHVKFVIGSMLDSRNNGETHLHLIGACVEHIVELRKANIALCR